MLRVGLTGGTACGKSTVIEMFRRKPNVHVLDADKIVHQLYRPGEAVHAQVVERFGRGIVNPDGTIDRKKLADIIFQDEKKLAELEAIVHPAVVARQREEMDRLEKEMESPDGIVLVEATKMLEAGTFQHYDAVLLVTCEPGRQLLRYMARHPELSRTEAEKELARRAAAQFSEEQRRRLVNPKYVLDNSGSREQTAQRVEEVYRELFAQAHSAAARTKSG